MTAIEPLCNLIGATSLLLSKEERILLEAELFTRIHEELKELFREQQKNYFRLLKLSKEQEDIMLESKFAHLIVKDILATGEYNLQGIAYYTDTYEDVIEELIDGRNTNPSATLLKRLINLHRSVRRDLYNLVVKKLLANIQNNKQSEFFAQGKIYV